MVDGTGTATDPWVLTTAPGSSAYTMHADPEADPPALICQVGSTTLRYHLRAVEAKGLAELTHQPRNNRMRAI